MWAVVPCKEFSIAKSRLASVLTPSERRKLTSVMLRDVLAVFANVKPIKTVVVASSDLTAQKCAAEFGALCFTRNCNEGLSIAVTQASLFAKEQGAKGIITVSADLPLLQPSDIACVLEAQNRSPGVVLAPADSDFGTNLLMMKPAGVIPFSYGDNSFFKHQSAARAIGIEPVVIKTPGLGLDIDTPEDLRAFIENPSGTGTFRYLTDSGIAERLVDHTPTLFPQGAMT